MPLHTPSGNRATLEHSFGKQHCKNYNKRKLVLREPLVHFQRPSAPPLHLQVSFGKDTEPKLATKWKKNIFVGSKSCVLPHMLRMITSYFLSGNDAATPSLHHTFSFTIHFLRKKTIYFFLPAGEGMTRRTLPLRNAHRFSVVLNLTNPNNKGQC